MNKCINCNENNPPITYKKGATTCGICGGVNTVLNTDQAYHILFEAMHDGVLTITTTEINPEDKTVYAKYILEGKA